MEFASPRKHYLSIKNEIDEAMQRVLESGNYVLGEEVLAFEGLIADYCNVKFAVGVNSGADALFLALDALGVGRGDEVIVPPFTMAASAEAVCRVGAQPVFADIDIETFNVAPEQIERVLTKKTRAIIPVHLFGQPAHMERIVAIAKERGLFLIEDACQSIGAKFGGRVVGGIGDAGALSFFPSKNLGGFGDGGMVLTNNEELAEGIRLRRAHGAKSKYFHIVHGINSRLDPLQAAVLRVKLWHLDGWTNRRREIASRYDRELLGVGEIILPAVQEDVFHVYHQYTIRTKSREGLRAFLQEQGVPTMQYYPHALHQLPIYATDGEQLPQMQNAERACQETLSLPIDPFLSDSEQGVVISCILEYFSKHAE